MTATNHALTGAIVGLTIQQPPLAIALALLSHFVLDVLPHYGSSLPDEVVLKKKSFRNYLVIEALLCLTLVIMLRLGNPEYWFIPTTCAFLAAAPDLFSINMYLKLSAGKPWKPNLYTRFTTAIQWFQRPIGAVVEVVWCASAVVLLAKLV